MDTPTNVPAAGSTVTTPNGLAATRARLDWLDRTIVELEEREVAAERRGDERQVETVRKWIADFRAEYLALAAGQLWHAYQANRAARAA